MDGNFALFNVAPKGPQGMDELLHLLAGTPEREAVWLNQDIVNLLVARFTGSYFSIFGCAGSFLDGERRSLMAEAVLNVTYDNGDINDNSLYYQSLSPTRITCVLPSPSQEFGKTVLLQGFATDCDFRSFARTANMEVAADTSMPTIIAKARRSFGFDGDYAAFILEVSGACTVRAALAHPVEKQIDAPTMFSNYAHATTRGDFVFFGVTTPTDYTKLGGHFHGLSLNGKVGGHLTQISAGSSIRIWAYEPAPEQIVESTY